MNFSPDRLRGHRHGQRRTTAQIGDLANLPSDAVYQFEGGYLSPTTMQIADLAAALDIEFEDLLRLRPTAAGDYCHAVLTYARQLTPDEVEIVAGTIRKIRENGK